MSEKPRILAIDDESSIRLLLKSFLSAIYDVTIKNDGKEALEWLESNRPPDLIVCDIQMEPMGGKEFVEKMRERGYTKHTPVIMLSSVEGSAERVKCYRLGAQDYLKKPFNPEELEAVVEKNLHPIQYAKKW
ncbi:MAG: response regulator [Bacteroidales bacterium]